MTSDDEIKSIDDSRFRDLSPGKLLVWARERANLTQEQVAKELYMTLTKVRSLESDDYRHMASDTFTRGYLRTYANLVKLDVEQLLAAYDRHAQQHGLTEQAAPQRVESANKPLWQFVVLVLAVLLVVWLVSIWFFDNRQEPSYNRPIVIAPPTETALDNPAAVEVMEGQLTSLQSSSHSTVSDPISATDQVQGNIGGLADLNTVAQSSSEPGSAQLSSAAKTSALEKQAAVAQLDLISFSFTQECWLEVSDSAGDVLIADLQRAGGRLQLQGKAPFTVKLGNAPGAEIELNGDKIAIVPALGTNVLSLKVGEPTRD